jgi:hypothetical protein
MVFKTRDLASRRIGGQRAHPVTVCATQGADQNKVGWQNLTQLTRQRAKEVLARFAPDSSGDLKNCVFDLLGRILRSHITATFRAWLRTIVM